MTEYLPFHLRNKQVVCDGWMLPDTGFSFWVPWMDPRTSDGPRNSFSHKMESMDVCTIESPKAVHSLKKSISVLYRMEPLRAEPNLT